MNTTFFMMTGLVLLGQAKEDESLLAAAHQQAQEYAKAYAAADVPKLIALTHPAFVKHVGGKEKRVDWLRLHFDDFKNRKLNVVGFEVLQAKEVHRAGRDLVVFLPTRLRLQDPDRKVVQEDHLVAVSRGAGKPWTYLERNRVDDDELRALFPDWPEMLRLPARGKTTEEDLKAGETTSIKDNYRVTHPKGWKKGPNPGGFALQLEQGKQLLIVSPEHGNRSPADLIKDLINQVQRGGKESYKELRRDKAKVDGVDAIVVHFETEDLLATADAWVATFENHGISYKVLGVGAKDKEKSPALASDFRALLDSFRFLGERKDWLATKEGKPVRTAFLAGLASIELNRPRWKEVTLDEGFGYRRGTYGIDEGLVESLRFRLFNSAAVVDVLAFERKSTAKTELQDLQDHMQERGENTAVKRFVIKSAKGFLAGVEVTGTFGRLVQVRQGCVFVKDGLCVHLRMDYFPAQRTAVQKDWEQLVASFRFEDLKTTPPLFPLRFERDDTGLSNSALVVLLKKATQLYAADRLHTVHSISPDGQQALITGGSEGDVLEILADRSRIPLVKGAAARFGTDLPTFGTAAAWLRDGKQIAYSVGRSIVVRQIGDKATTDYDGQASALAFLPDNRLLAVQQPLNDDPQVRFSRFAQQKLVRFDDDTPTLLLEFPLARISRLAVSPDGTKLALVTNKDAPRTSPRPGNLYVANPDGTGLRQLTKGPETILSVAWSDDGRWLYVVRHSAGNETDLPPHDPPDWDDLDVPYGDYLTQGRGDLYRIAIETGEAENLTRCGMIDAAWVQGEYFLLRIPAHGGLAAQSGIFKVAARELATTAAALPEPRKMDAVAQAKKIAARVKAAFAPQRLTEVVLTPESVDKLARAFAEAAVELLGEPFDYSAASLDALRRWARAFEPARAGDPALHFGMGAYYGETLRKLGNAEWRLEPVPVGDWLPGKGYHGNAIVEVLLPFTEVYRARVRDARSLELRGGAAADSRRRRLILAYPPAIAGKALREATPKALLSAQELFDKGEVKKGLELYLALVGEYPNNESLAHDALDLAHTTMLPALGDRLAETAVDAGTRVPEWLIRRADALAKNDPIKALELYRKAAQAQIAPASVYLKLGKQLAAAGQQPLAEACFRRAYFVGGQPQQRQARELLGLAKTTKDYK